MRKFVNMKKVSPILGIDIVPPEKVKGIEYFYPDGVKKWRGKVCFLRTTCPYSETETYYESAQEYIDGLQDKEEYYIDGGVVYKKGEIKFHIDKAQGQHRIFYQDPKEMYSVLEKLKFSGFPVQDFLDLNNPDIPTLYEFIERRGTETKR